MIEKTAVYLPSFLNVFYEKNIWKQRQETLCIVIILLLDIYPHGVYHEAVQNRM